MGMEDIKNSCAYSKHTKNGTSRKRKWTLNLQELNSF